MLFEMPKYHHPDFTKPEFVNAPDVKIAIAEQDGVAPEYYHSTSMYPEYFKIGGQWIRKKQVTIRVHIPARPFLGLSEDDMAEIKGTVEDFLEET